MTEASSVIKVCGADAELGNILLRGGPVDGSELEASRALLREFDGVPAGRDGGLSCTCRSGAVCTCGFDARDVGRKFLPTSGGSVYIDLSHLELCTPEVTSAFDHVAAWHAMLRAAQDALAAANARLPEGSRILVVVNNSDGHGHAYGSHLSFLVTRRTREMIFERKAHYLQYLASFLASAILLGGAGKVGSENLRPAPEGGYQISQRADFFVVLSGPQTTYDRPIVNSRDETLGDSGRFARLHVIFFDNTLCHGSCLLKVGATQLILAMLEGEAVKAELLLDDPVEAVVAYSHDPDLGRKRPLAAGGERTALDVQRAFHEEAARFVDEGRAEGVVPRAREIVELWGDTLEKLGSDPWSLAARLDWILKRAILERAAARHGHEPGSAALRRLDLLYGSLDPDEGLFWAQERSGAIERLVTRAQVERFVHAPPRDTRAWARAMLLRRWGARHVETMDWGWMKFRTWKEDVRGWPRSEVRTLDMPDPRGFTRRAARRALSDGRTIEEALELLAAAGAAPAEESGAGVGADVGTDGGADGTKDLHEEGARRSER